MSEIPPIQEPDPNRPSEGYAQYPRGAVAAPYGTAEQLQALADAYFGLNWVFLVNFILALALRFLPAMTDEDDVAPMLVLVIVGVMFLTISLLTYPHNKKIAFGKGWAPGMAVVASILMGINSALCCGIIGYIVMQTIAAAEMKHYGLKTGFLGVKKKIVEARVAEMKAAGQTNPVA